jgi:hypothetical protein
MQQTMKEFPHLRFGLRRKEAENSPAEPPVRPKRKARGERPVAEAASKDGQTERDERDERDGMDEGDEGERVTPNQTDSSPIKPNQTKSNLSEGKMDLPEGKEGEDKDEL